MADSDQDVKYIIHLENKLIDLAWDYDTLKFENFKLKSTICNLNSKISDYKKEISKLENIRDQLEYDNKHLSHELVELTGDYYS